MYWQQRLEQATRHRLTAREGVLEMSALLTDLMFSDDDTATSDDSQDTEEGDYEHQQEIAGAQENLRLSQQNFYYWDNQVQIRQEQLNVQLSTLVLNLDYRSDLL